MIFDKIADGKINKLSIAIQTSQPIDTNPDAADTMRKQMEPVFNAKRSKNMAKLDAAIASVKSFYGLE